MDYIRSFSERSTAQAAVRAIYKTSPSDLEINQYLQWERMLLQCAKSVKISSNDKVPDRLNVTSMNGIEGISIAKENIPETLAELLLLYDAPLNEKDQELRSLAKEAQDKKIAYFTDEEEADDMAAEILALVGIDPKVQADKELASLEALEQYSSTEVSDNLLGDLSYSVCKMLREQNWTADGKQAIYIHLGAVYSSHHSTCYRVFNLDQERALHQYQISPDTPNPPGPSFAELKQLWERQL